MSVDFYNNLYNFNPSNINDHNFYGGNYNNNDSDDDGDNNELSSYITYGGNTKINNNNNKLKNIQIKFSDTLNKIIKKMKI